MSQNFETYQAHTSTFRTWLVAYGIGLPAIILSNDPLWIRLQTAGINGELACYFITGVVLQVLLALLNKTLNWIIYSGEDSETIRGKGYYKFADKVSEWFLIDVVVDIASLALFARGTYILFLAVA